MPAAVRLSALAGGTALVIFAVAGLPALGAQPGAARRAQAASAHVASQKSFSANVTYDETNPGKTSGASTMGIQGHGRFSAKLRGGAAIEAALIAFATGVPITKIVKGGTYKQQWNLLGDGSDRGLIVASFKAHGLGTVCVSYLTKHGTFMPGDSFIPASGSMKLVGGTGAAATWRGSLSYKQTNVTGSSVEQFSLTGSEKGSTGKPKPMTAACLKVAKLR